jgi:hypothetical protein
VFCNVNDKEHQINVQRNEMSRTDSHSCCHRSLNACQTEPSISSNIPIDKQIGTPTTAQNDSAINQKENRITV